MLEGLDNINWSKINDCFGPATEVPRLIRYLAWNERKIFDQAINDLYSHICHQGTVYEASAYAVPFLYELADEPSVIERSLVIALLGHIAQDYPITTNNSKIELSAAAYHAVRARFRQALPWLDDPNFQTRLIAANLLATFREECEAIQPPMEMALGRERNRLGKAAIGLALGLIGIYLPEAFVNLGPEQSPILHLKMSALAERLAGGSNGREVAFDTICTIATGSFSEEEFDDLNKGEFGED